ncbi:MULTISPECIES: F0F1 ATP synthase subunit delta [Oleiagrimonas]|uniref:ATP synthase subunit delta n=1 Tax=Oleiagrimonas citrea TaxID=1665687 RepID=A0A846ZQB7_9GAMM|nr:MULTISPECIES: F0F1 ATP synthase subunit delta [Oleiagrimonas]NKZ39847.1 F0F1 ATP synthase subunit delta [Oleiagrimonas citrea]RAP56898.1 F0F1 ATP synthase subunit delta [Oleiagrimonas sp. MCCC 1A03011]
MMEALTLARPYARAAFELAQEKGTLNEWSQALAFAAAVASDPRIAALCSDPRVEDAQLVAMHLPAEIGEDALFARFLAEMAAHGRMHLLVEVQALFDALKRESESVLKVRVTSAMALDDAQTEQLKASLKRRYQREIDIAADVDPALLAGIIIDTGEQVIDGSARGRLQRLASALTH